MNISHPTGLFFNIILWSFHWKLRSGWTALKFWQVYEYSEKATWLLKSAPKRQNRWLLWSWSSSDQNSATGRLMWRGSKSQSQCASLVNNLKSGAFQSQRNVSSGCWNENRAAISPKLCINWKVSTLINYSFKSPLFGTVCYGTINNRSMYR